MPDRSRAIPALLLAVFVAAFLLGRATAPFQGREVSTGAQERAVEPVPTLRLPTAERR